jgi:hypothetical protein
MHPADFRYASSPKMTITHKYSSEFPLLPTLTKLASPDSEHDRLSLLASVTFLSDSQIHAIHQTNSVAQTELTLLKQHIDGVASHLEELNKFAFDSERAIFQQKYMCSSLRHFPAEIIFRVMQAVLGMDDADDELSSSPSDTGFQSAPVTDIRGGMWPLSQVCRIWRQVALSSPRLWSRVKVRYPLPDLPCPLRLVETYLERSFPCALHLDLQFDAEVETGQESESAYSDARDDPPDMWTREDQQVFHCMLRSADRWASARFVGMEEVLFHSRFSPKPVFHRLTALSFRVHNNYFNCLPFFRNTKSLKYLHIDMDDRYDHFLDGYSERSYTWLSFLSGLEELSLMGTGFKELSAIVERAPELKSLVLCGKVCMYTEKPVHLFALRKLDIAHMPSWIAEEMLKDLVLYAELEVLSVHAGSLKALSLASELKQVAISLYDDHLEDAATDPLGTMMEETKDFLRATPSLESVKLICNPHFHYLSKGRLHHWSSDEIFGTFFMGLFDLFNCAKQNGTLPRLKHVEIEAECILRGKEDSEEGGDGFFAPHTFMNMVESRGYGSEEASAISKSEGLRPLEKLTWRSNVSLTLTPDDQLRLATARKNGFSFDVEVVTSQELTSRRLGRHY